MSPHARRIASVSAVVLAAALRNTPAIAAPSGEEIRAAGAARELFLRAEEDEDAGRWDDAMAKLRQVSSFKPTAGIRYHIAFCEEHAGELAAALADYIAAEQQARSELAADVLRLVGARLGELAARVPRLTVRVLPARPDAIVKIDGVIVGADRVGAAVPVDPGVHRIEASAPGPLSSEARVTVVEGERAALDLALEPPAWTQPPFESPAPAAPPDVHAPPPGAPPRTAAIVETVAAVVLASGGVAAYLAADRAHGDAVRACAGTSSGTCESQRLPVRAWDWVAVGSWSGAATVATLAVLSWSHAPVTAASGRLVVAPGALRLEGTF